MVDCQVKVTLDLRCHVVLVDLRDKGNYAIATSLVAMGFKGQHDVFQCLCPRIPDESNFEAPSCQADP